MATELVIAEYVGLLGWLMMAAGAIGTLHHVVFPWLRKQ